MSTLTTPLSAEELHSRLNLKTLQSRLRQLAERSNSIGEASNKLAEQIAQEHGVSHQTALAAFALFSGLSPIDN